VRFDFLPVDQVFGYSVLVDAHGDKNIEDARMNISTAIGNNAHYDLLPPVFSPYSASRSGAKMRDIAHYPMHRSCKEDFVLIKHGDRDEQLRFPAEESGT
jgi:hypothetical protein